MIREIVTMPLLLQQPSRPATQADLPVAQDLLDTLAAHRDHCVGLAANMIGVRVCIIAVTGPDGENMAMLNPAITSRSGEYQTSEGCLSLPGERPTTRYRNITVEYQDLRLQPQSASFTGLAAQAIQHEIDHCNGVLI